MQLTFNLFSGPLSRNNLLQSEGKVSVRERLITPVELWAYSSTHSTCHRNLKKAVPQIKFNVKTWQNKNTLSGFMNNALPLISPEALFTPGDSMCAELNTTAGSYPLLPVIFFLAQP